MKTSFAAVCVLALAVCTVAAEKLGDWENLNEVRPGQKIEVLRTDTARIIGNFVTFTDYAITLSVDKTEQSIARDQVARVSSVSHRLPNSVLMGIAGMLVLGIVQGARTDDGGVAWLPIAGLGAGTAVGIVSGAPKVYYRR